MKYGYNYPWSGRLGRLTLCCIYCGEDGPPFQVSSSGTKCLGCKSKEPIPKLLAQMEANYEREARIWCIERGINYRATVENYKKHLGEPQQERNDPIPGSGGDYTVYFTDN